MDDPIVYNFYLNQQNYPDPDIPVEEAWKEMKQLLKGNTSPAQIRRGRSRNVFVLSAAGAILVSIVAYFFMEPWYQKKETPVSMNSQNKAIKNKMQHEPVFLNGKEKLGSPYEEDNKQLSKNALNQEYLKKDLTNQPAAENLSQSVSQVQSKTVNTQVSFDSLDIAKIETGKTLQYHKIVTSKNNKPNPAMANNPKLILEFDDTPLEEAIEKIEKAYAVAVEIENDQLNQARITTRFDNKSLNEVLDIMAYTLNFKYTLNEKTKRVLIVGNE